MDRVAQITRAVLYEGYVLWPYRRSAPKNRQRWTFGGVFPEAWSAEHPDDRALLQAQCLVEGPPEAPLRATLRCLHVVWRQALDVGGRPVDALSDGDERHLSWEEAAERELEIPVPGSAPLAFDAGSAEEQVRGGAVRRSWDGIAGTVEARVEALGPALRRFTVRVRNTTAWPGGDRPAALRRALVSTHLVLRVDGGAFVSAIDPPAALREEAAACENAGTWPVLAGEQGDRSTLLCAPIILEDHPAIAPESPGDLFDGGEIDQLLILNILALSEEERREMRDTDPRTREILDRCAALGRDELMGLHGTIREMGPVIGRPDGDRRHPNGGPDARRGTFFRGERVRLCPRPGRDIWDLALSGRIAVVEGVDETLEGERQVAVVLEDDPGRALGEMRQIGHRFFFALDEVEPVDDGAGPAAPRPPQILVAGIGNVFLADDGFGPAVAQQLAERPQPAGVRVVDYGIRGIDLVHALQDDPDAAILVDALPGDQAPGTITVLEPELDGDGPAGLEPHGMDPVSVLTTARALGAAPGRTLVVGCEPLVRMTGEEPDVVMELSEPVAAAVSGAVAVVESLLAELTERTVER